VEIAVRNIRDKWAVILKHYKEYFNLLRSNNTNSKFSQHLLENSCVLGKMDDIMEIMYFTEEEHIIIIIISSSII